MHVQLRNERFLELCTDRGWATDTDRARALGVDRANLGRLIRGEQLPSAKFIAACRLMWPGEPFDDLFETVRTEAVS